MNRLYMTCAAVLLLFALTGCGLRTEAISTQTPNTGAASRETSEPTATPLPTPTPAPSPTPTPEPVPERYEIPEGMEPGEVFYVSDYAFSGENYDSISSEDLYVSFVSDPSKDSIREVVISFMDSAEIFRGPFECEVGSPIKGLGKYELEVYYADRTSAYVVLSITGDSGGAEDKTAAFNVNLSAFYTSMAALEPHEPPADMKPGDIFYVSDTVTTNDQKSTPVNISVSFVFSASRDSVREVAISDSYGKKTYAGPFDYTSSVIKGIDGYEMNILSAGGSWASAILYVLDETKGEENIVDSFHINFTALGKPETVFDTDLLKNWNGKALSEAYGAKSLNDFKPKNPTPMYYIIGTDGVRDPVTGAESKGGHAHSINRSKPIDAEDLIWRSGRIGNSGMTLTDDPDLATFALILNFNYTEEKGTFYFSDDTAVPQYHSTLRATLRNLVTGESIESAAKHSWATYANESVRTSMLDESKGKQFYGDAPTLSADDFEGYWDFVSR